MINQLVKHPLFATKFRSGSIISKKAYRDMLKFTIEPTELFAGYTFYQNWSESGGGGLIPKTPLPKARIGNAKNLSGWGQKRHFYMVRSLTDTNLSQLNPFFLLGFGVKLITSA